MQTTTTIRWDWNAAFNLYTWQTLQVFGALCTVHCVTGNWVQLTFHTEDATIDNSTETSVNEKLLKVGMSSIRLWYMWTLNIGLVECRMQYYLETKWSMSLEIDEKTFFFSQHIYRYNLSNNKITCMFS